MATDVRGIDVQSLPERKAPALQHELRIVIDEDVFDHAVSRGNEDTTREVGGVLVGRVARDVAGPYLHVDASIDALHAEEKGAELTFTHDTWDHIHKEMDGKFAGKQVVGWWHTHPGFGIFLSDRDQFIHKSFFDLPFQVALVYDPKAKQHGVFAWRNGEAARARQYWIGDVPQSWDGDRSVPTPPSEAEARRASDAPAAEVAATGPDWIAVAIVGVIVAIAAGLLGWWLGGARAPDARQIQAQLIAAESAGAQRAVGQIDQTLIRLWRETMEKEGVGRELDTLIRELEKVAQPPAAPSPALDAAIERMRRLRTRFDEASSTLYALEGVRRTSELSAARREIAAVELYLGNLYAELADEAVAKKDLARAKRYLIDAATVDPANRSRYEKKLRKFDRSAKLPPEAAAPVGDAQRERGAPR